MLLGWVSFAYKVNQHLLVFFKNPPNSLLNRVRTGSKDKHAAGMMFVLVLILGLLLTYRVYISSLVFQTCCLLICTLL